MLPRLAKSGSNCSLFGMFLEDGNSMERCEETVSCTSLDQFEFGVLNFFFGGGGRVFFLYHLYSIKVKSNLVGWIPSSKSGKKTEHAHRYSWYFLDAIWQVNLMFHPVSSGLCVFLGVGCHETERTGTGSSKTGQILRFYDSSSSTTLQ